MLWWISFCLAGPDVYGYGDGHDGDVAHINDRPIGANAQLASNAMPGDQQLELVPSDGADDLAVGDLVALHVAHVEDLSITDSDDPVHPEDGGTVELARLTASLGEHLWQLDAPLEGQFLADRSQVVHVYEYRTVTVEGVVTPHAWNGSTGGVLVVFAQEQIAVSGRISATGSGHRGGLPDEVWSSDASCMELDDPRAAPRGEGLGARLGGRGRGAIGNAGGGGVCINGGGAGGGSAGAGGAGGYEYAEEFSARAVPGVAFVADALLEATPRVLFGGGGGSGESDDSGAVGGGGAGGGALWLRAPLVVGPGAIDADGREGGTADGNGGGGGGGGGTVWLQGEEVSASLSARGGTGGGNDGEWGASHGPGGGGGGGVIRLDAVGDGLGVVSGGVHGLSVQYSRWDDPPDKYGYVSWGAESGADGLVTGSSSAWEPTGEPSDTKETGHTGHSADTAPPDTGSSTTRFTGETGTDTGTPLEQNPGDQGGLAPGCSCSSAQAPLGWLVWIGTVALTCRRRAR